MKGRPGRRPASAADEAGQQDGWPIGAALLGGWLLTTFLSPALLPIAAVANSAAGAVVASVVALAWAAVLTGVCAMVGHTPRPPGRPAKTLRGRVASVAVVVPVWGMLVLLVAVPTSRHVYHSRGSTTVLDFGDASAANLELAQLLGSVAVGVAVAGPLLGYAAGKLLRWVRSRGPATTPVVD